MRDAMLSVCPIDNCSHAGTMGVIGREDRALLRSNPSARTDAGTSAGSSRHGGSRSPCLFWPESDKPRGFGGRAPKADPGAVCQLSRLQGGVKPQGCPLSHARPPDPVPLFGEGLLASHGKNKGLADTHQPGPRKDFPSQSAKLRKSSRITDEISPAAVL